MLILSYVSSYVHMSHGLSLIHTLIRETKEELQMAEKNERERDFFTDLMFGRPRTVNNLPEKEIEPNPEFEKENEEGQVDLSQVISLIEKLTPLIDLVSIFLPKKKQAEENTQVKEPIMKTIKENADIKVEKKRTRNRNHAFFFFLHLLIKRSVIRV